MKTKLLLSALLSFSFYLLSSQVPQGFNYQAIARDVSGDPLINKPLQVKLTIKPDSSGTGIIWEEIHSSVTTNAYGMFTVVMGKGTRQSGSTVANFSDIDWSVSPKFLKIDIYYNSAWKFMGTTRLYSVPYAMIANDLGGTLEKLKVRDNGTNPMDSALFEVRNKTGQIVFAVYNEGVRIYVDDGIAKGATKGGFAIGSFDKSKGMSQPLFVVDPDSIRAYIDTSKVKAVKGGFAIGSFSNGKGMLSNFMEMTPKNYFIGEGSGSNNISGRYNSFMGYQTGLMNTTGGNNAFLGYQSGYWNANGSSNIFLGYQSGFSNTSGNLNSFLGYKAGYANTTGGQNSFLGSFAGISNIDGSENTFIGYNSGFTNNAGSYNNFIGTNSGYSNLGGLSNIFIGPQTGYSNTNGSYNIFVGYQSGYTNTTGNFNVCLGYKTNIVSTASYNTFIGYQSGSSNTTGGYNEFIGYNSGLSNTTGNYNVFIGHECGKMNTSGLFNTLIGYRTGAGNTSGRDNVFVGETAGSSNTTGSYNVFLGSMSGISNITGTDNIFIGSGAGQGNRDQGKNIYIGNNSGAGNPVNSGTLNTYIGYFTGVFNSTGIRNVFNGYYSGYGNTTGSYNTYLGGLSCYWNTIGTNNVAVGYEAGGFNITGSNNVFIGSNAGLNEKGSNKLFIDGTGTGVDSTGALIYGEFDTKHLVFNANVGIGTTIPTNKLEIGGTDSKIYMNSANSNMLSFNANGVAIPSFSTRSLGTKIILYPGESATQVDFAIGISSSSNWYSVPTASSTFAHRFYAGTTEIFTLRGDGNVGVGNTTPGYKISVAGGAYCTGTTWTNASDKNLKENFEIVDGEQILELIGQLPVERWNYKTETSAIKHIGPVAQDFYSLFGLGNDDKSISSIDPSGVALVAIKELSKQNSLMKEQIESYKTQLQTLQEKVDQIEALLAKAGMK